MKKQKIIKTLQWMVILLLIVFTTALCICCIKGKETTAIAIWWSVSVAVYAVLNLIDWRLSEQNDPLSIKKQKIAISYCAQKQDGTKKEFTAKYGEKIYNHFLRSGIIHELHITKKANTCSDTRWEFTIHGEEMKNRLFA